MVYRPPFIKQLDGSGFGGQNCTLASACMATVRHHKGVNPIGDSAWYPKPSYFRYRSGDTAGGTTLAQADYVASRYYNANLDVEWGLDFSEFRRRIESGQGAIVQGRYSVVQGTAYDACPGFYGNHAVYVNELRWSERRDRWEYLWYDPLADGRRAGIPRGPQWMRQSLLKEFAEKLVIDGIGNKAGNDKIWAAFTRDTESVILRHGGTSIDRKLFYSRFENIRLRRAPRLDSETAQTINKGQMFRVNQIVRTGPLVDGSRIWYGNAEGTKWTAAKNLTATAPVIVPVIEVPPDIA